MNKLLKKNLKGYSLMELLIVISIIAIISAIAVPSYLAARRASYEASAIGTLRTLVNSQLSYQLTNGGGRNFAGDLNVLIQAGLADSSFATGSKSGYKYVVTGTAANEDAASKFDITAIPITPNGVNATGTRSFYSNETGVIYFLEGATAPERSDTGSNGKAL
ncbi:MAG: prepilin-type N-terminal cleavage/methylation domain-containing protein [Pyrinomonadaceae bacterium]